MHRLIIPLVVLTAFCLSTFSQSPQSASSPIEVSYARSGIQWSVFVPSTGAVLTISGPDGLYWRQEYGTNSRPQFGALDEQGVPRPEGLYRWELVAQLPPGAGGEVPEEPNPVVSGSFAISGGTIVPKPDDGQPAMIEEGAPVHSLFLDRAGRLGLGTSVPQSQLHLKGSSPAFTLEDTTTGGGAFTLRGLAKGDGSLGLFDRAGKTRWLVDNEGRLGINTSKPTSTLTVDGYIEATKGFLVDGKPLKSGVFGDAGGAIPLSVEGTSNNFFGTGAGASTTGVSNSFFGGYAGQNTTTGSYNSIFGRSAGQGNTTGGGNSYFGANAGETGNGGADSFFGDSAGRFNTGSYGAFFGQGAGSDNQANGNSFFGYHAGYTNTTGSADAFFGYQAGDANTTGSSNSFFGSDAGHANTTGPYNSFFGSGAGAANTTARQNAFFGESAGGANIEGSSNSFFGQAAGRFNTVGAANCFFGQATGYFNTASNNSFFGASAGSDNGTGSGNSFFGQAAGRANTTATENSFFGREAGHDATTGARNSFFGAQAGAKTTTSGYNAFFGAYAGYNNTTGATNDFFGDGAGSANTTGSDNSFFGDSSGPSNTTGSQNSAVGRSAGMSNTVENFNTFVGYWTNLNPGANPAVSPVTNATAIGSHAYVAQSNSLVLGSINGVNNATSYVNVGIGTSAPARQLHLAGPNAVFRMDRTTDTASFILVRTDPSGATPWKTFVVGTNANGLNQGEFIINDIGAAVGGGGNRRMTIQNDGNVVFTGTVTALDFASPSSITLKTNIRTLQNAIGTVSRLRGVRFDWKESGKAAVGLIAEEVDEVLPELVAHEAGKATGVNYANLVAVLVEAVKEQQRTIQEDRKTIREQQAEIENLKGLKARMEKLEALLQAK